MAILNNQRVTVGMFYYTSTGKNMSNVTEEMDRNGDVLEFH